MESILPQKSYVDHYLRQIYADIIKDCIKQRDLSGKTELAQRATQILKENTEIRPYYTRNWLLLGEYTKFLARDDQKELLLNEAHDYFEKAYQLSSKRIVIFIPWLENDLRKEEYQTAKEKAQECINTKAEVRECWWFIGLTHIFLEEIQEAEDAIRIAVEQGYRPDIDESLYQLAQVYEILANKTGNLEYYQILVDIYQELIYNSPKDFQRHASLAFVYVKVGDYENARKEAMIVLELSPESRQNVEEFLRTLSQ